MAKEEKRKEKDLGTIEPKKSITVSEGKHTAKIVDVKRVETPQGFDYVDYYFQITDIDEKPVIKSGVPTDIKTNQDDEPTTKHAKLLKALGFDVTKSIKPIDAINKEVTIVTVNETTDKGTFARVAEGSIKLEE